MTIYHRFLLLSSLFCKFSLISTIFQIFLLPAYLSDRQPMISISLESRFRAHGAVRRYQASDPRSLPQLARKIDSRFTGKDHALLHNVLVRRRERLRHHAPRFRYSGRDGVKYGPYPASVMISLATLSISQNFIPGFMAACAAKLAFLTISYTSLPFSLAFL